MPDRTTTTNSPLQQAYRLTRLVLHLAWGALITAAYLTWVEPRRKNRIIHRWSAQLLKILHLHMHVLSTGQPAHGGRLIVANHISWLDIWVLNARQRVFFVSKDDVRNWPLIGWLAHHAGTFFIDRSKRHDTARINAEVTQALQQGAQVALFPEGTTTDGSQLRPFHTSLLQPAIAAGAPVQPVAISYRHKHGGRNQAPAYHDDTTLMQSLREVLKCPEIIVQVHCLPPIDSSGKSRRELAREAERAIASALNLPVPHKAPETPPDLPAAPH